MGLGTRGPLAALPHHCTRRRGRDHGLELQVKERKVSPPVAGAAIPFPLPTRHLPRKYHKQGRKEFQTKSPWRKLGLRQRTSVRWRVAWGGRIKILTDTMKNSLLHRPKGEERDSVETAPVRTGFCKEHAGMCEYGSVNTP